MLEDAFMVPVTSNAYAGALQLIPTLPLPIIRILSDKAVFPVCVLNVRLAPTAPSSTPLIVAPFTPVSGLKSIPVMFPAPPCATSTIRGPLDPAVPAVVFESVRTG